ncbi:hypothetical protein D1O30_00875 [Methylocystis hirsuta]|uniref:Uncharacterized protein n=1 Tax=Methylocystis hirsuta TaxID=369798 RepID=A0A3M9XKE5_9HYPH|nr:hypothetical protein D1O30_00875 [Methylocystis hirsuta]
MSPEGLGASPSGAQGRLRSSRPKSGRERGRANPRARAGVAWSIAKAVAWGNDLVPFRRRLAAIAARIAQERPSPQAPHRRLAIARGSRADEENF